LAFAAPSPPLDSAATQSSVRRHTARRSHRRSRCPRPPRAWTRAPPPLPIRTTWSFRRPWRGSRKCCAAKRRGAGMHMHGASPIPVLLLAARVSLLPLLSASLCSSVFFGILLRPRAPVLCAYKGGRVFTACDGPEFSVYCTYLVQKNFMMLIHK
jgi:hypothetical protein